MIENENVRLIHGDCIELMGKLVAEGVKVDAIITDPPYNIARANNFQSMGRAGIDFGEWDKNFDLFSYLDIAYKLLDKNGSIIIFNDWKNLGDIVRYCDNLGFVCKDMIRLEKSNPMPRNRDRRYITDYECAVWLTMPKAKWIFNRQSETYERPKFIGSIESGLHPTQKNTLLMEWLIKIHSNENQVILDPFMGSGTTGVACKNLNRKFIGIELDENYFNIAKDRIESIV